MATETKRGNYKKSMLAGNSAVYFGPSRCVRAVVTTAASTATTLYDGGDTSGVPLLLIPSNGTGSFDIDAPCDTGIYASVGTSGVLLVVYSQHK